MTRGRLIQTIDRGAALLAGLAVRSYQVLLSPLLVGGCRHIPSCSTYAVEAFQRHGFVRGSQLTLTRIWRCRPGGTFGYDPVPHVSGHLTANPE